MWLIMIKLTVTIFLSKLNIHPKVLAINVTLDKRSWEIRKHPPFFIFYFLFIKKYFCVLRDPVVKCDLICFGLTAPGIFDVFRLVLDIDTLTPMSCQQNVLWSQKLFLGCLRDLVPSCWLEDRCLDTFSLPPHWWLLFPLDFFRIIQSKHTIIHSKPFFF